MIVRLIITLLVYVILYFLCGILCAKEIIHSKLIKNNLGVFTGVAAVLIVGVVYLFI